MNGPIWAYRPEMLASIRPLTEQERAESARLLAERHAETLARIDARFAGDVALHKEKEAALAWCRANGNPHHTEDKGHE